jgi:uncharacterized protein YkuJ
MILTDTTQLEFRSFERRWGMVLHVDYKHDTTALKTEFALTDLRDRTRMLFL